MTEYSPRSRRAGRPGDKRLVPPVGADVLRCFAATFPSSASLLVLADLRRRLEPLLTGLRWTARENLHFTLRFFGDLTGEDRELAAQVLDAVVPEVPVFSVHFSGVGVFPNWHRPRVLWVGVGEGSEPLIDLARRLERGFYDAGLGSADKPFVPHLTLGRWREGTRLPPPPGAGTGAGPGDEPGDLGSFPVVEVGLFRSMLAPTGPSYTPIHTAALGASGTA